MGQPNALIFVDFPSPNPDALSRFYGEVFNWATDGRPEGIFHRMLPGGTFKNPDGTQSEVGNLHLGAYDVRTAAPDPRPAPFATLESRGPAPRIYILVGDNDSEQAILERASARGAEILWSNLFWKEFNGFHGAFMDPWGTIVIVWTKVGDHPVVRPEQMAWGETKGYPNSEP